MKGLKRAGRFYSGNVRFYFRHTEPPTPMPDAPPDSAAFTKCYAEAVAAFERGAPVQIKGRVHHKSGTIGAGIVAFLRSDHYLTRAASTRDSWRRIAEKLIADYASGKLTDLRPKHIAIDIRALPPHPANNRLKLWRAMGRWWVDAGLLETDPARDVRPSATPDSDGHEPWTDADVAAFRLRWPVGTMQRLAFELAHQTGAAVVDLIRLGPANLSGAGWLTYTRGKSGTACTVPLLIDNPPPWYPDAAHLRACLAAAPRHMTWLTTQDGASRSRKSASQWFSAAARAAGIEGGKSAHGVRKRLAVYMAEHGATEAQRMAILGHDTSRQTRAYSKTASAQRLILGPDFDNSPGPVAKKSE